MTAAELIGQLQRLDPNLQVYQLADHIVFFPNRVIRAEVRQAEPGKRTYDGDTVGAEPYVIIITE